MNRIKLFLITSLTALSLFVLQGCYTTFSSTRGVDTGQGYGYEEVEYSDQEYDDQNGYYDSYEQADSVDEQVIGLRADRVIIQKYYYYPRYAAGLGYAGCHPLYVDEVYDPYYDDFDIYVNVSFGWGYRPWYPYRPYFPVYYPVVIYDPFWWDFYPPIYYPVIVGGPYVPPFVYYPSYGYVATNPRPFKKRDWERRNVRTPVRGRRETVAVASKNGGSRTVTNRPARRGSATVARGGSTTTRRETDNRAVVTRRGRQIPQVANPRAKTSAPAKKNAVERNNRRAVNRNSGRVARENNRIRLYTTDSDVRSSKQRTVTTTKSRRYSNGGEKRTVQRTRTRYPAKPKATNSRYTGAQKRNKQTLTRSSNSGSRSRASSPRLVPKARSSSGKSYRSSNSGGRSSSAKSSVRSVRSSSGKTSKGRARK